MAAVCLHCLPQMWLQIMVVYQRYLYSIDLHNSITQLPQNLPQPLNTHQGSWLPLHIFFHVHGKHCWCEKMRQLIVNLEMVRSKYGNL